MSRFNGCSPRSGEFPHVLVTEHYPHNVRSYNRNIVHGSGTRVEEFSAVFLDKPPFNAKSLELLLEVHPFVPNSKGEPEPAGLGVFRTDRVQV